MALVHGNHDLRILDTTLEDACEVAAQYRLLSWRIKFERAVVVYCPACGAARMNPYGFGGEEVGLIAATLSFRNEVPESCESSDRLNQVAEVMES